MRAGAIGAAFALTILAASPAIADNDALLVSQEVMQFYNGAYQRLKSPRAIAVAEDGFHFGYSYCPEYRCYMNPTARSLALQACAKAGGRGCRVFAIDDEIQVSYQVMDTVVLPKTVTAVPSDGPSKRPCLGKTEKQCEEIAADFGLRRRQMETDWDSQIDRWRQLLCGPPGAQNNSASNCKQKIAELNGERSAALKALDDELVAALSNPAE